MHFMNPQRAAHMSQIKPMAQADGAGDAAEQADDAPIGTEQSGYAGPENGPFECGNCVHFDGQSKCDHPTVVSDPQVQGNVEPEGCCNYFSPAAHEGDEGGEEQGTQGAGDEGEEMPANLGGQ